MERRSFSVEDRVIEHNLERLDHLCRQAYSMEERLLDDLIIAVIESYELLPESYKRVLRLSSCYTHGSHWGTSQARRDAIWTGIRSELNAGLMPSWLSKIVWRLRTSFGRRQRVSESWPWSPSSESVAAIY